MQHPLWHKIPLVRLLIPFICGIGVSMFCNARFETIIVLFVFFFVTSVGIFFAVKQYAYRWLFGVVISACLFAGGWALHVFQYELRWSEHYHAFTGTKYIVVVVDAESVPKLTSYKLLAKSIAVMDSMGKYHSASGRLMVFVTKKDLAKIPVYGDVLLIPVTKIASVKEPRNPDEFDFKQYLALKQIYFQAYLTGDDIVFTGENRSLFVFRWVYGVQQYFKKTLAKYIGSQNETGVAEALLYGYDKDIDDETKQAYSNTGTLHVLAVSGMHVGIIYMILSLLLTPLGKVRKGKMIKQLVILFLLWVYSFICGLSPSILRATVMFSFIIAAGLMDEQSSVYNTLAASVFVLLCFDANLIVNVGFQLSYLAVLGIIFFQPYIATMYTAPNWFVHQIWSVTAVSLAAQLVTFPIGLFYFHQFPNCFLLSNLLMIPLTTLILYTGIVLLVISSFSWLALLLGKVLYYLILFTNELVKWLEHIPFAYVNGINITVFQSVLLYAIIFLVTLFLVRQQKVFFKWSLYCCVAFCCVMVHAKMQTIQQERFIVYHMPKQNAIQWMLGSQAVFIADSALIADANKIQFHIRQHTLKSGIQHQQIVYTDSLRWQKITLGNHTVLIAGTGKTDSLKCDLLIIKNKVNLTQVLEYIQTQEIVLTSAVKPADAAGMIAAAKSKNIDVKYVGDTGAIELSLW
jgi:competence protein ComEC